MGLALAAFWLLQAFTGSLLVFRWELEDALLPGTRAVANAASLGARVESISRVGGRPLDVWASSQAATRFDIYYVDAGGEARVMRVDGRGRVLRDAADAGIFARGAFWDTLTLVHTGLVAGEAGRWIVALSGVSLLCNLVVGLRMAWPRVGQWKRVLITPVYGGGAARLQAWHRRLGLWLGIVILPFIAAGVFLCFEDTMRNRFDAAVPLPRAEQSPVRISPATALAIAHERNPTARLSALILPGDSEPWYRVRQQRPGELPRNWGTSTLFVAAADGRILGDHSAAAAPARRALVDALYPLHTGQAAGAPGRLLVLLQGTWLATMTALGALLWRARRRARQQA